MTDQVKLVRKQGRTFLKILLDTIFPDDSQSVLDSEIDKFRWMRFRDRHETHVFPPPVAAGACRENKSEAKRS